MKFPSVFWPSAVMVCYRTLCNLRLSHYWHKLYVHDVTQTSGATEQHKTAFLQNTACRHNHHLYTSSDNLVPPESNRSFSCSAELNWDYGPSWQRKMHQHSWPWQSVELPFSRETIKNHFETGIFTSGFSFLAFVSRCCRKFSNAFPKARTEAFGLGISTGECSHACPRYFANPQPSGQRKHFFGKECIPSMNEL